MPVKPCHFPSCPELIPVKKSPPYCDDHEKKMLKSWDSQRETAVDRGYTTRWVKLRNMKMRNDPMCERCGERGKLTFAELIHHVDGNARHNDMDNLQSLCRECHGEVHAGER